MKLTRLRPAGAKHCFLLRTGMAVAYFREMFDRPDAMLKVFDLDEVTEEQGLEVAKWGDDPRKGEPRLNSNLIDATRIQNIAAFHGLAPWVYGLGTISLANKLVPVQITEDVGTFRESAKNNDDAESVYRKVVELGKKYGFGIEKEDVSTSDVINGKLVDFQTFAFNKDYKETVKEMYIAGKYGKVYYQDVPELGLSGGPRKTVERFTTLGLDKIDFKDKVVLDVGCAGGSFLRYAIKHGAKRGIGIDIDKGELEAAFHVSNWLGKYNIDYVNLDVVEYKIDGVFDITFFLSMNYHVGYPSWILEATKEKMVFEDNGKVSRTNDKPDDEIARRFNKVEFIGKASDHGDKPIYHLTK